ncbi:MAG: acyltransferase [Actinomycetota bacterium]|nr:acyltransferase [Actinomycetota bacterium]
MPDRYRTDVQGLRAIAVVSVVAYHAAPARLPGGYAGVDVFFVLSGFVITRLLWREVEATGRVDLAGFYARRARRLLPSAALVLLVTVAGTVLLLPPLAARSVLADATATALYAGNYRFAHNATDYLGGHSAPSPLLHYWSLGVEEQFYLIWPLLLLGTVTVARRRPYRGALAVLAVLVAGSLALSVVLTQVSQPWAFFSLPTRAWELGAGAVVALVSPALSAVLGSWRAPLAWSGLAGIALTMFLLTDATPFPGVVAVLPVASTAAVLLAESRPSRRGPGRVLAWAPLQQGGRMSYAWYLWHWPVLVLGAAALDGQAGAIERTALVVLSVALAYATVRLLEEPLRHARVLLPPRRALVMAMIVTVVTGTSTIAAATALPRLDAGRATAAPRSLDEPAGSADRVPHRPTGRRATGPAETSVPPAVTGALAAGAALRAVPGNLRPSLEGAHADIADPFTDGCHASYRGTTLRACAYGSTGPAPAVLLTGDSHATQWFPALAAAAQAPRNWRLTSLTKTTCPPVTLSFHSPVLARTYSECDEWRARVLERIRTERPAVVVLGAARHYSDVYRFEVFGPQWLAGWTDMVRQIRATGAQVVVLGPPPLPGRDVPDCLAENLHDAAACATDPTASVQRAGIAAERATVARAGGRYVDVTPWFCVGTSCPAVVGNLLVYRDDNHLTTSYAGWLAPLVAAEVEAALGARGAATG